LVVATIANLFWGGVESVGLDTFGTGLWDVVLCETFFKKIELLQESSISDKFFASP